MVAQGSEKTHTIEFHINTRHAYMHFDTHSVKDWSLLETHLALLNYAEVISSAQVDFRIQKGSSSIFVSVGRARAQTAG